MIKKIDAIGKPCPLPVIEAKRAIRELNEEGGIVEITVDNDIARQNLEKMTNGMGFDCKFETLPDKNILVQIFVTAGSSEKPASAHDAGAIIAVGSRYMGKGDDTLGELLMKSYIFSLTELDTPPEHLLFFNSGAYLTCNDSAALEDLKTLSKKGTLISTCGTCLNYYKLSESLAIGEVANMYAIASIMDQANKVITL